MTSLRTWSSGSTSRLAGTGALLTALILLGGGCATRKQTAPPPPLRGYVNLDALTRQHPGWSGVGRYDAALHRLDAAARSLPPPDRPDQKIATLPALPPAPQGAGASLSPTAIGQEETRLTSVQQSLLDGLRSRRAKARAEQIAGQQDGWQRAARQQYPSPTQTAVARPDVDLQLLRASIEALTRTLDGWKESTPPAPEREKIRVKVEDDRTELQKLTDERVQARNEAQSRQEAETYRVQEARAAYASGQAEVLESRLNASDGRYLADQQGRLTRQRIALLGALARPAPVSVPAVGDAGAQTLPEGPGAGRAALAQKSLLEAEAHLTAQRARWVRHLYDDTRATALDTAGQHNWDVTFGPPRPGDRDLTQPMAQAMRAGAWRL